MLKLPFLHATSSSVPQPWDKVLRAISPLVGAVLFAACFPPYNCWPLAFIAFVPLLLATLSAKNSLQARAIGLIFGSIFYTFTLRWLWQIFPWFCLLLWAVLALFPALFTWTIYLAKKRWGTAAALIAAPCFWVGIEYFRSELWWLKFAWLTPGFSQAANLPLLQTASLIGVYGISALILIINSSCCWLILKYRHKTPSHPWKPALISLACLMTLYLWGATQLQQITPGKIPVGAIQTETSSLAENTQLSQQIPGKPQLIVWPEYSLFEFIDEDTETFQKLSQLAAQLNTHLIVSAKEKVPEHPDKFYNTALLLAPNGKKIGSYYKNNPVQYFDDGTPGKKFPVFPTEIGKIGIAICYDMDFSHVLINLVKNGAEIIAIPTYDAMWWTPLQHLQHSAMAPARAIEHRRWIVRPTSSGISQIIDPYGRIQTSLPVGETGVISGLIDRRTDITLYNIIGYRIPQSCVFLVIMYLGIELLMAIKFRSKIA
ncbi:MAG TPA: hypothetical protein IGS52_17495 [Oscillatoriaceae cyanobacterium M33_DOE_052]|uniref:Apolipoprotein N-acyltransferase n=1 Tax=Planktothricoides sp. SpSt-374 TaxID=2282167 RepID=A0A7C3VUD6_9CYAN|nr:hypothetical protein [Oscillatoriaceae cyanobacterium M33_DOE_052]